MNIASITAFTIATAAAATALMLVPGVFLAWLLSRRRFRGRVLLERLESLTLVIPPVETGLILLMLFSPRGPFGSFLAHHGVDCIRKQVHRVSDLRFIALSVSGKIECDHSVSFR